MEAASQATEQVVLVRLRNTRTCSQTLCLEPWGEAYAMAPGTTFDVVARGPQGDSLEIEVGDADIVVFGWPGSFITVLQDGVELGAGFGPRTRVPGTPDGTSVAQFLRVMMGPPTEGDETAPSGP
jgi:hypothetical protein